MPIQVKCSCGKQLRVPDDYLGKRVKCPACGTTQTVQGGGGEVAAPAPSGMVRFSCACGKQMQTRVEHAGSIVQCPGCGGEVTVPGGRRPRAAEPAITSEPIAPRASLDFSDDPDDRPRGRRGRQRKGGKAWLVIGGLCLLLLLVGGGIAAWFLFFAGVDEDLALIPADAQAFVTVRVAEVYKSDVVKAAMDAAPPDARDRLNEFEGKVGVAATDVERVTVVVDNAANQSMWVIIRTSRAYDIDKIKGYLKEQSGDNEDWEEKTYKGKKYFLMDDSVLYPVSDTILVIAPDKAIEGCINQQESPVTKGRLADAIKEADSSNHFVLAIADPVAFGSGLGGLAGARHAEQDAVAWAMNIAQDFPVKEPFPDVEGKAVTAPPEFVPGPAIPGGPPLMFQFGPGAGGPEMNAMAFIADLKLVMLVGNITDKLDLTLTGSFGKEDSAKAAKGMLDMGKAMAPGLIGQAPADAVKMANSILEKLTIEQDGADVIVSLKGVDVSKDTVTPMINEAMQKVAGAGDNAKGLNNLRQIGLAMHTFHDAHGHLPPVQPSPQRHPNLSWRVDLLPHLEHHHLWEQIRKDEPFDSPHNRQFWNQMPAVYASPGMNPAAGQTRYQVFRGQNTPFSGQRQAVFNIPDGTSNTIMVVEAGTTVNWMAPDDINFQQSPAGFPASRLGMPGKPTFPAVLCDGSVRQIPKTIDPNVLQNLIMINDGNVVEIPD